MEAEISDTGYQLKFDDCISENERNFYKKLYPQLELVVKNHLHCTTCNTHIGTAPDNKHLAVMHPVLRVTQCYECNAFYTSGEFSKGEDGSELYCRWCGQGGEVYCCAKCPYVFCTHCITKNISKKYCLEVSKNDNWNCFSCDSQIIWNLRAQQWALVNFMDKQIFDISKLPADKDKGSLMAHDSSKCCESKKRSHSRRLDSPKPSTAIEKKKTENVDRPTSPQPTIKRKRSSNPVPKQTARIVLRNIAPVDKTPDQNEVVCTPDILSMFNNPDESSTSPPKPIQIQLQNQLLMQTPQTIHVPTMPQLLVRRVPLQFRPTQIRNVCFSQRPPIVNSNTVNNSNITINNSNTTINNSHSTINVSSNPRPIHMPLYHTINGYRVDLNSAALQDTFRLPNGKIIQVKKHNSTTTPLDGQTSTKIPSNIHGNNITTIVTSNLRQQTVAMDKGQGTICSGNRQGTISSGNGRGTISCGNVQSTFSSGNVQGTTTGIVGNVTSAAHTLINNNSVINAQQPQNQPLTPLENSLKDFDKRLDTCKEICEHIIGKINTLRNTNQFKSASKFYDCKNLHIHLTYLCKYAVSRFKTLQDKCNDDIETINKLDPPDTDIDNDDIEIVEPHTTLINLDSDNEDDDGTCKNNQIPINEALNNKTDNVIVTGEILKNILIANLISNLKDKNDKKTIDYNFIKENVIKITKGRVQKCFLPDNNQNIDEPIITMTDVVTNGNAEDIIVDNIVLNNNSSHMDTTSSITDKNASTKQITPIATSLTINNKINEILNKNNIINDEVNISNSMCLLGDNEKEKSTAETDNNNEKEKNNIENLWCDESIDNIFREPLAVNSSDVTINESTISNDQNDVLKDSENLTIVNHEITAHENAGIATVIIDDIEHTPMFENMLAPTSSLISTISIPESFEDKAN